ncbi:Hypothetical protein D9617_172g045780 [Elsinoe fawcettii]|nr:Hypothetical protein D9617_172g045780 [Elsinoe fawcettii]
MHLLPLAALAAPILAAPFYPSPYETDLTPSDPSPPPFQIDQDEFLPNQASSLAKRQSACSPQPAGIPSLSIQPDTPSSFLSSPLFINQSQLAPTPTNYTLTYRSLSAASQPSIGSYLGFTSLSSYNVSACAALCTTNPACLSFNIYFQRSPSLLPGPTCPNPPSVTRVKCVLWTGPAAAGDATNAGQWRAGFRLLVAGSNAYSKGSTVPPEGYQTGVQLEAAIDAPLTAQGEDTYLGAHRWGKGFEIGRCAEKCDGYKERDQGRRCEFFNTYLVWINGTGKVQGQECSLYSQAWNGTWATNKGQYRGGDRYGVMFSYGFERADGDGTVGNGTVRG